MPKQPISERKMRAARDEIDVLHGKLGSLSFRMEEDRAQVPNNAEGHAYDKAKLLVDEASEKLFDALDILNSEL